MRCDVDGGRSYSGIMVGLYSDRLPDLNWFLNIAASPGSPTLLAPKKKSISFTRKKRRSCQPIQHVIDSTGQIDYNATNMKPPLSYAQLIMDAMAERQVDKITLSEIYEYAARRYAYYRSSKGPWKNSIRHNLSCNQLFKRIPRKNGEKGKGSYWTLNEAGLHCFSSKKNKSRFLEVEENASKPTSRVNSAVLQYMDSLRNRQKPIAPHDENNSPAGSSVQMDFSESSFSDVGFSSDDQGLSSDYNWQNDFNTYDLDGLEGVPFVGQFEEFHCDTFDIDPNTPPQWQDVDQYYNELMRLEGEELL
ncbi:fork head domain protein [Necator americanus]|uniref:Fork head domain protein n=1 Tax=Necator americanus TaxID=51031 RepID=W2TZX2_NECAM|nr:fork head domain protein [Necator americanus]ETN87234.1 fork head domain protein [Necator americanus]